MVTCLGRSMYLMRICNEKIDKWWGLFTGRLFSIQLTGGFLIYWAQMVRKGR